MITDGNKSASSSYFESCLPLVNSPRFHTSMHFTGGSPFYALGPCLNCCYEFKIWVALTRKCSHSFRSISVRIRDLTTSAKDPKFRRKILFLHFGSAKNKNTLSRPLANGTHAETPISIKPIVTHLFQRQNGVNFWLDLFFLVQSDQFAHWFRDHLWMTLANSASMITRNTPVIRH